MSYLSLTRKVKCRFYSKELREKNYQIHLQRKHPNENTTNKRSAGQKSIFDYTKISAAVTDTENLAAITEISAANAETSTSAAIAETLASTLSETSASAAITETLTTTAIAETSAAITESPVEEIKICCAQNEKIDNILEHLKRLEQRLEGIANVDYLQSMSCSTDIQKCPCSQVSEKDCFWPTYHEDCKTLETSQTYQGVPLFMSEPENFNITRAKKVKVDPIKNKAIVERELTEISLFIIDNLRNVFTEDDLKLFEHVKVITDLKLLAAKIKIKGVVLTAASELEKFLLSVKTIVHDLKDIPPSQLELQYRMFLDKMEEVIKPMPLKEYKELTSISLIKTFFSSKLCLFKSIELIMHSICIASTISSVESVCESLTSTYEYHNSRRRQITEESALHEMMISVNGPLPTNCDSIISEAMNCYFAHQKDWHFVRRSNNLKDWTVSKCVDKLMTRNSSLPFMDIN